MAKPYPLEDKPRGKCRKWQLRKSAGRDPATGKYKTLTQTFSGTWTEACRAQADFERDVEAAPNLDKRLTVSEYLAQFIRAREASGDFAAGTITKYRRHAKALGHCIGHARLSALSPLDIERAYADLRAGKSPSGRRLSGTYVNCAHRTLVIALERAVEMGLIAANPAKKVHPPKADTKEKRALPSAGIAALVGKLGQTRNETAILLCVVMGLRRGETLGLSWGDVDARNRLLTVSHSLDDFGNLKAPKTAKGLRQLPMPERVAKALDALKESQAAEFAETRERTKSSAPVQTPQTPVFADACGQRMKPHYLSTWWRENSASYNLTGWTLHELRHSYLTELARQGAPPKVVQELAGHSNVSTTLNIYTHANLDDKRAAVDSFENALGERFVHDSSMAI